MLPSHREAVVCVKIWQPGRTGTATWVDCPQATHEEAALVHCGCRSDSPLSNCSFLYLCIISVATMHSICRGGGGTMRERKRADVDAKIKNSQFLRVRISKRDFILMVPGPEGRRPRVDLRQESDMHAHRLAIVDRPAGGSVQLIGHVLFLPALPCAFMSTENEQHERRFVSQRGVGAGTGAGDPTKTADAKIGRVYRTMLWSQETGQQRHIF